MLKAWILYYVFGIILLMVGGCSSYSSEPRTIHLPVSNQDIDVVLHRSDIRFLDCSTLSVIQTYNRDGLIDSKEARGEALHCKLLQAGVEAGGRVGAASLIRPARTTISNSNGQSQTQGQGQSQGQQQDQSQTANGGNGGGGNGGGNDGSGAGGNNGGGNGSDDGTNPGTGHHHDNGDNN